MNRERAEFIVIDVPEYGRLIPQGALVSIHAFSRGIWLF